MTLRDAARRDYQAALASQPDEQARGFLDAALVHCVAAAAELGWDEDRLLALRSEIARSLHPGLGFTPQAETASLLEAFRTGSFRTGSDATSLALQTVAEVIHPLEWGG